MPTQNVISILWSDEALIVVDKPAGLPTLPDGWDHQAPYLVGILQAEEGRLWVVHRLDRQTSGALVLARTAAAHRALNMQFDAHGVEKVYHALVLGAPEWTEKLIMLALRPNGDRQHRTVIDQRRGKPAVTQFRVLERFDGCALVEARPQTGRTHQIRAHLAAVSHPLLADTLYGGAATLLPANEPIMARAALHACSLMFRHPITGEDLRVEAPYPADFAAALAALR